MDECLQLWEMTGFSLSMLIFLQIGGKWFNTHQQFSLDSPWLSVSVLTSCGEGRRLGHFTVWKRLRTADGHALVTEEASYLFCRCRPWQLLRVAAGCRKFPEWEGAVHGDYSHLPRFPLWSHYITCFWATEDLLLSSRKLNDMDSQQDAKYSAGFAVFSQG